jgi:RecA-family ATPase
MDIDSLYLDEDPEPVMDPALGAPVLTFGDAVAPPPPADYVIGPLQPGDGGMLAGGDGAGKGWVALAMGATVATGRSICGIVPAPEQAGPVVYITGEDRVSDHLRRMHVMRRWMDGYGIPPPAGDMMRVIALRGRRMPLLVAAGDEVHPTAHLDAYRRAVDGARLVIIDPLVMFHDLEERSTRHMDTLARTLTCIAMEMGHALIVVHHASQEAILSAREDHHAARGATAFAAAMRGGWTLRRCTDREAQAAGLDDRQRLDWRALSNGKSSHATESCTVWLRRSPGGLLVAQEVDTPADMAHERQQEREVRTETARRIGGRKYACA